MAGHCSCAPSTHGAASSSQGAAGDEAYSLQQVDGKEQQQEAVASQQEAHHGTRSEGCTQQASVSGKLKSFQGAAALASASEGRALRTSEAHWSSIAIGLACSAKQVTHTTDLEGSVTLRSQPRHHDAVLEAHRS